MKASPKKILKKASSSKTPTAPRVSKARLECQTAARGDQKDRGTPRPTQQAGTKAIERAIGETRALSARKFFAYSLAGILFGRSCVRTRKRTTGGGRFARRNFPAASRAGSTRRLWLTRADAKADEELTVARSTGQSMRAGLTRRPARSRRFEVMIYQRLPAAKLWGAGHR